MNRISKIELLETLNTAQTSIRNQLKSASHVVLTFGTAWIYTHIQTNSVVANCHKQPAQEFEKSILSSDQLTETFEAILSILKAFNPEVTVIFSISPVRHLKDGFVENNQSKAHLIAALHSVLSLPKRRTTFHPTRS